MINKDTGAIELAGAKIRPFMLSDEVRKLNLGESQEERDMGNGYCWYYVRNIIVNDRFYNFCFGFNDNELYMLLFGFSETKIDLSEGWESWNEAKEKSQAIIYNNWLFAELGSERKFKWGEVSADYDPKSGSSDIVIRYI
jgi:hypothetical protein